MEQLRKERRHLLQPAAFDIVFIDWQPIMLHRLPVAGQPLNTCGDRFFAHGKRDDSNARMTMLNEGFHGQLAGFLITQQHRVYANLVDFPVNKYKGIPVLHKGSIQLLILFRRKNDQAVHLPRDH
ncbi:hypothetical protein D3C75_949930 [compost metagenome]